MLFAREGECTNCICFHWASEASALVELNTNFDKEIVHLQHTHANVKLAHLKFKGFFVLAFYYVYILSERI